MKPLVLFIVGPTASGKSAAAVELARLIHGEIISADSMQVYQRMDIGTAKPALRERKKIPHYLLDEIPPSCSFSVFDFYRRALKAIKLIHRKGKIPIVAGGTGLYVRSLLQGFEPGPSANPALRKKLSKIAEKKGSPYLHQQLQKKNPARAAQLNPNDLKRIIRALEILETPVKAGKKTCHSLESLGFEVRAAGLQCDRQELYGRINRRVDAMFRKGLVREAKSLLRSRISPTASQALGYKEVWEALKAGQGLDTAREAVKLRTRHFAKRQMTWFRREPGIRWVEIPSGITPRKAAVMIARTFGLTSI